MIRIRFHGRGGHGVKTAGRIVGTAAFLAGWQGQDSPVYGAERRGAAVASYARIDDAQIRERGMIARPDLLIVADETLLDDQASGVLAGADDVAALFVNSDHPEQLTIPASLRARLVTSDLTSRTLAALGRAAALSAGLGAVAARLAGVIPQPCLLAAIREELAALGVSPDELQRNERLAGDVFDSLAPASVQRPAAAPSAETLATIAYDGVLRGTPSVLASGNSAARRTGAWRVERPVIDPARCTRCGMCFVQCPDGAVTLDADGYPVIDYDHCKGCLICGRICPVRAIHEERETRAW